MQSQNHTNQIIYFASQENEIVVNCAHSNSSNQMDLHEELYYQVGQDLRMDVDGDPDMDGQENDRYQLNVPALHSQSSEFSEPPILSYSYSGISNASSTPQFVLHSSRIAEQTQVPAHFVFLKAQKLFSTLQKLVNQVRQILSLQDDISLYLLHRYKWDKQKLFESYMNCCKIYSEKNYLFKKLKNMSATEANKQQELNGICQVCGEQARLIKNLLCTHSYCQNCWRSYIKQQLHENRVFFPCMNKCQVSGVLLHHFIQRRFGQLFELYRKIICINFAAANKSISYCPSQKSQCDVFCQRSQSQYDVNVQCPCGQFYCFFCRKQPHQPATCEDVTKWQKLLNDQSSNSSWIAKNTKTCPNCKNQVEKYIGCSKIKCVCGAEFCYDCNTKWDANHKSNKGQCQQLVRKSSLEERSMSTDFVMLHERSMAIDRTLNKNITTLKLVFQSIKQQWIQVKFQGVRKEVVDAWTALKWGNIVSFIYKKGEIEAFVQQSFIQSLVKLMQSIQKLNVQGLSNLLCPKDVLSIGQQVNKHRQTLKKNKDFWFQAWRSS